jgi:putative addiction module CopG family antidote
MTITLTPQLDQLISSKLATGRYKSVEHVLTEAMRALNEEEETLSAIAEGYEDFLAGRVYTLEEANEEFYRSRGLRPSE